MKKKQKVKKVIPMKATTKQTTKKKVVEKNKATKSVSVAAKSEKKTKKKTTNKTTNKTVKSGNKPVKTVPKKTEGTETVKKYRTPVYVIGHKHPDTDCVCASIAYANLKRILTGEEYVARRAGDLNEETRFVLKKWGVEEPPLLEDARTQVRDIEVRHMSGASADLSMKRAWEKMEAADVVTLCITKGKQLEGLITTGDIVRSYMDIYDADFISKAKTTFSNIIDTVDGELLAGSAEGYVEKGKVVIAAASPEVMEQFIDENDVVLVGNRYETQLCAIELNAKVLIICGGVEVASTIIKFANEHGCLIIRSPHDTFTVARLINQSVPISYFMKSDHLITFDMDDYIDDIQEIMAQKRFRYFPVLNDDGNYIGMVSRRNFLGANRKRLILMDHNERNQAVNGVESAEVLEIVDHHRLASVETLGPVYFRGQPLGSTCTIVYQMYKEAGVKPDKTTAALLLSSILSDTLMYRSPTCTDTDRKSGEELAKIVDINVEKYAMSMFRAGSNLQKKTPEEILGQDFKRFTVGDKAFGVGQISSLSGDDLNDLKTRLTPALESLMDTERLDMVFFMMTNILTESSDILSAGDGADALLTHAFGAEKEKGVTRLPGMVSRKKQFLPALVEALQN